MGSTSLGRIAAGSEPWFAWRRRSIHGIDGDRHADKNNPHEELDGGCHRHPWVSVRRSPAVSVAGRPVSGGPCSSRHHRTEPEAMVLTGS